MKYKYNKRGAISNVRSGTKIVEDISKEDNQLSLDINELKTLMSETIILMGTPDKAKTLQIKGIIKRKCTDVVLNSYNVNLNISLK